MLVWYCWCDVPNSTILSSPLQGPSLLNATPRQPTCLKRPSVFSCSHRPPMLKISDESVFWGTQKYQGDVCGRTACKINNFVVLPTFCFSQHFTVAQPLVLQWGSRIRPIFSLSTSFYRLPAELLQSPWRSSKVKGPNGTSISKVQRLQINVHSIPLQWQAASRPLLCCWKLQKPRECSPIPSETSWWESTSYKQILSLWEDIVHFL